MKILAYRLIYKKISFKYNYRSCEDILEALKPLLKEQKCYLTITDEIIAVCDRVYVKATAKINNSTGEIVEVSANAREEDNKKGMDSSQLTGSTSSYARKYALNGLFCIDDTKDSDCTNNHDKEKKQQPQQKNEAETEVIDSDLEITLNECKTKLECQKWQKDTISSGSMTPQLNAKYRAKLATFPDEK